MEGEGPRLAARDAFSKMSLPFVSVGVVSSNLFLHAAWPDPQRLGGGQLQLWKMTPTDTNGHKR